MLKLRQREEAIARGVALVEWTFDPLELKNAFFNIERLGAIIRRYVLNQYGTTTSHLHGGLPTDRCVAEWHVSTARVARMLNGQRPEERIEARIEIPLEIARFCVSSNRSAPDEIQQRVSESFLDHFRSGLAVVGFERARNDRHIPFGQMGIRIERAILRHLRMPLVHFFETSFSRTYERDILLVEVVS